MRMIPGLVCLLLVNCSSSSSNTTGGTGGATGDSAAGGGGSSGTGGGAPGSWQCRYVESAIYPSCACVKDTTPIFGGSATVSCTGGYACCWATASGGPVQSCGPDTCSNDDGFPAFQSKPMCQCFTSYLQQCNAAMKPYADAKLVSACPEPGT